MSSRNILSKLKGMKYQYEGIPKMEKGMVEVIGTPEDGEELGSLGVDDAKSQYLSKASKLANATATIDLAFKGAAIINSMDTEDWSVTADHVRNMLGVSSTNATTTDVEKGLDEIIKQLEKENEYLKEIEARMIRKGVAKNDEEDNDQEDDDEEEA